MLNLDYLIKSIWLAACFAMAGKALAQPTVLTSDSLALVAIYNTSNGSNWTAKNNWLTGPVDTWFGITVAAGRVSEIHLSNNGLAGTLPNNLGNLDGLVTLNFGSNNLFGVVPRSILNLVNLKYLYLSGNRLSDLPNLSESQLLELQIDNNNFFLKDIISNIGIASIQYSPQNIFDVGSGARFPEGEHVIISCPDSVDFPGNEYLWYKDDELQPGREAIEFEFSQISIDNLGEYKVVVTNPLLPDLELTGYGYITEVYTKQEAFFEYADGGDLTSEGYHAGSNYQTDQNYSGQWGDFNNDGYDDIAVATFSDRERSYFYINNQDGTFSKIPNSAYFYAQGRLIAWGDYNNDGWLDAFSPGGSLSTDSVNSAYVFKNNGNETFTQIVLGAKSTVGVWSDTDNDGDLDLIVNDVGQHIILYRNDGDDVFTPLSGFGGVSPILWYLLAIDLNNDGRQDVLGSNDQVRQLHISLGGNQFELDNSQPFITNDLQFSRGASFADVDNDGDYDAFFSSISEYVFYINDGSGHFTRKSSAEVCGVSLRGSGRGSAFFDFDNDGYIDLLTYGRTPLVFTPRWLLFKNNGDGTFSQALGQNFRAEHAFSGASVADYNNDGFLDISSASFGEDFNGLYRNKGNGNNWLQIKLVGVYSNRSGIGSKIDVYAGGLRRHHQVIVSNGFANNNSLTAHFGVGSNNVIDSVVVRWPSGIKQKIIKPDVNQKMVVNEDPQGVQTISFSPVSDKVFGSEPFKISATSTSKLPIVFSSSSDKISIAGDLVTLVKPGKVSITATQGGDTYYSAVTEEIEFCINPAKPTIFVAATDSPAITLTSSALAGNQWFRNEEIISGAISQSLTVEQDGTFKVQVSVDDCVSVFSESVGSFVTAIQRDAVKGSIVIHPNPFRNQLTITFEGITGVKTVVISNTQSKEILSLKLDDNEMVVPMDKYPGGVYLVKILTDSGIHTHKLIKGF